MNKILHLSGTKRIRLSIFQRRAIVYTICFCIGFTYFWWVYGKAENSSKSEMEKLIFSENSIYPASDALIVNYIRKYHLHHWNQNLGYNFTAPKKREWLDVNVEATLEYVFGGKIPIGGFFIETGAHDGETLSNTIELELRYNWTGLLIEGSPYYFSFLKNKNRKAWISDVCLSGRAEQVEFLKYKDISKNPEWRVLNGKINPKGKYAKPLEIGGHRRENYVSEGKVDCFPLESVLAAISDLSQVDFFSLDVEGHEYKILQAIPFHKINIKVIKVEYIQTPEGEGAIKSLMIENGYSLFSKTADDMVFYKKFKKQNV